MSEATFNVFFTGPEGFDEHFQIKAEGETPDDAVAAVTPARSSLVTWLQAIDAKAKGFRAAPPAPAVPAYQPQSPAPMVPAASRVHECGMPMKYIRAGISKAGKAYPAFFKCDACNQTANA